MPRPMVSPISTRAIARWRKGEFSLTQSRSSYWRIIRHRVSASLASPAGLRQVSWHTVPERVLTVRLDGSVEYGPVTERFGTFPRSVLAWEPPSRLLLSWDVNANWQYDPALKTELEIRFIAEDKDLTRVELEHRKLDRYGTRRDE